jgi:transposase
VAIATGVSEKVAQKAIHFYNSGKVPSKETIGRHKLLINPALATLLRETFLSCNNMGTPATSTMPASLLKDSQVDVEERTLRRYLRTLGFRFGRGIKKHILHDATSTIEYRKKTWSSAFLI